MRALWAFARGAAEVAVFIILMPIILPALLMEVGGDDRFAGWLRKHPPLDY